jgi:hypothetical protein
MLDKLQIFDLNFDLIPLDYDLFSLEIGDAIHSIYLNDEFYIFHQIAESIKRCELFHGPFLQVLSIGEKSSIVFEILKNMESYRRVEPIPKIDHKI